MNLGNGKGRLLLLTAIAGSSAVVLAVLLEWAIDQIMRHTFWRSRVVFLTVFEWAYLLVVALSLAAMPILLGMAFRRRPGAARSLARRMLLALASLAIGLALAEATAWAWLSPTRRAGLLLAEDARYGLRVRRERLWPPITSEAVALPESFYDPPVEADIDLVILGGSSAAGVPFSDWLSIGHLLAWKLEAAIPGRPVRLHLVANSGDTLELQHQKLAPGPSPRAAGHLRRP